MGFGVVDGSFWCFPCGFIVALEIVTFLQCFRRRL